MQTREFSKVEGMELKAKKTEGDLTPKKNEVLGDNKNKGGDVTPKGKSNIDPSDAGMYSPPEAVNEGQRDIEPAYSPANSEDARKLLEYQAEDEKEKQKKFGKQESPTKNDNKTSADMMKEVASALDGIELKEDNMSREDQMTLETLKQKSLDGGKYFAKVYNLQGETNCKACPRRTERAFALFNSGALVGAAKCDTLFCLFATLTPVFFGMDQTGIGKWLDTKMLKKIEKITKGGKREQVIHEINDVVGGALALGLVHRQLKFCLEDEASVPSQAKFLELLQQEGALESFQKFDEIDVEGFKDLAAEYNIQKNNSECACGKKDDLCVTIIAKHCLAVDRVHVHCGELGCLVESLESRIDMAISARPRLIEGAAKQRADIDEKKASAYHRLIFVGKNAVETFKNAAAWKKTEEIRIQYQRRFLDLKETEDYLPKEEDEKERHRLESKHSKLKQLPKKLKGEIHQANVALSTKAKLVSEKIQVDKEVIQGQEFISEIEKKIKLLEFEMKAVKEKLKEHESEKQEAIKKTAVAGVTNAQILLKTGVFEELESILGAVRDIQEKTAEYKKQKLLLEETSAQLVRFYEGILEIPKEEKIQQTKFKEVLEVSTESEESTLQMVSALAEKCGMMNSQAKQVEKENWKTWYEAATEARSGNHKSLEERAAALLARNKALLDENTRLSHEVFF